MDADPVFVEVKKEPIEVEDELKYEPKTIDLTSTSVIPNDVHADIEPAPEPDLQVEEAEPIERTAKYGKLAFNIFKLVVATYLYRGVVRSCSVDIADAIYGF